MQHNPKLDIFILIKQFKLGNVLGLTPVFFKSNFKRRIMLSKVYPLVLIAIFVVSCVFTVQDRSEHLYKEVKVTQTILDVAQCVSQTFFVAICLLGAVTKYDNWKLLFLRIKEVERKLNSTDFKVKKSLLLNNVNIIIYHLMFLLLHLYESYDWITTSKTNAVCIYLTSRIGLYYQLFELIFICKVTRMLKRRYDFLQRVLNDTIAGNSLSCFTRVKLNLNLNDICRLYKVLYSIVQQFNCIFGWQIFFIVECTILEILNSINVVLNDAQNGKTRILITNVICSLVYIVSTVTIVMSCDGVEQSGKKIVKTCFMYQDVMEKPSVKDDSFR